MIDGSWLVMSQGPQPGQTFMLDRDWLTVGRDPSNDIVINDPQVSRQHIRVTRQGQMVVIEDLGSTNGTFANGVRLTGPHVLSNGDVIGLGDGVTLTYYEVGIAADIAETIVGHPGSAVPQSYEGMPAAAPGIPVGLPAAPQMPPTAMPGASAATPPPPVQQIPPAYTLSPPMPPEAEFEAKKRSKLTWVLVVLGILVLLTIVACAVVFVLDEIGVLREVAPFMYVPLEWLGITKFLSGQ
ncbi:MAG: FHA domain-containing protein [Anaerolineae bacterium]|jgi:predicted component of type VI protein secretion system